MRFDRPELARVTAPAAIDWDEWAAGLGDALVGSVDPDGCTFRFADGCRDWRDRVAAVRELMARSGSLAGGELTWSASGIALAAGEAREKAAQWCATGEPPVLRLIALAIAPDRVATRGLAALVGQDVVVEGPSEDSAILAARLARHVLRDGPLTAGAAIDQHGRARRLKVLCEGYPNGNQVIVGLSSADD